MRASGSVSAARSRRDPRSRASTEPSGFAAGRVSIFVEIAMSRDRPAAKPLGSVLARLLWAPRSISCSAPKPPLTESLLSRFTSSRFIPVLSRSDHQSPVPSQFRLQIPPITPTIRFYDLAEIPWLSSPRCTSTPIGRSSAGREGKLAEQAQTRAAESAAPAATVRCARPAASGESWHVRCRKQASLRSCRGS